MWGRIFFSLFVNTFEKILYNTFHKLMGRNSETNSGFLTLGFNVLRCDLGALVVCLNLKKIKQMLRYPYQPNPNNVNTTGVACHRNQVL